MKNIIAVLMFVMLQNSYALSVNEWNTCKKNVYNTLEKRGIQEHGSPTAYLGASGSGADSYIKDVCGNQPVTQKDCKLAYKNTYSYCISEKRGLSNANSSYIELFSNSDKKIRKIENWCAKGVDVSYEKFIKEICN